MSTSAEAGNGRTRADADKPGKAGPLPVGQSLGPWRLESLIGAGAMGAVYRGQQRDGVEAAIKVLLKGSDPKSRTRFLREERAMRRIEHPNVIRVLDSDGECETPWIALEFVEGEDLHALFKREGPLSTQRLAPLAVQVLRGLGAAHEAGVVHRDLKPANILIGQGGQVKLADFGLARREAESLALTRAGQLMGTPYYMSPEQAAGEEAVASSDIYSFGAILYHLLSGVPVFKGPLTEIIMGHLERPAPRLNIAGVPPRLVELIAACLLKNPAERPSLEALMAMLSTLGGPGPAKEPPPRKAEPPPSPKPSRLVASDHQRVSSERRRRLNASGDGSLGSRNPYLPEGTTPEVEPAGDPPAPQPSPPFPRSRRLDLVAGFVLLLVALVSLDQWFGGRYLSEVEPLNVLRRWLVPPQSFAALGLAAVLICERLWCVLDRILVGRKVRRLKASGQVVAASGLLEALGRRRAGGQLLLESGRYELAASMFLRGGFAEQAGEAFERSGKPREALRLYRTAGSMENAFRVALSDTSEEAVAYLIRYGQVDDVVEVYRKAKQPYLAADLLEREGRQEDALRLLEDGYTNGDPRDYWEHLGRQGSPEEARRRHCKRIAWLHEKLGRLGKAAAYWEAGGKLGRACDLYAKAGWRDDELRCCEAALGSGDGRLRSRMRRRLAELATLLEAEGDLRAAHLLALLDRPVAAAKLAERLGDLSLAADYYLQGERLTEAADVAERGGDRALAARLLAETGEHARAAALFEQLGRASEAAQHYGLAGMRVQEAQLLGRLGDPLGAASALIDLERYEEAEGLLAEVPGESGQRYDADRMRAGLLRRRGRLEEALELYEQVLGEGIEFEEELEAHLSRIECARELGRNREAAEWLQQLQGKSFAPADLSERLAAVQADLHRESVSRGAPASERTSAAGCAERVYVHAHALVGETLDRYSVSSLIGEGSFAWVYRAKHVSLGRTVALKLLKPALCTGDTAQRFLREGQALAGLEHPNLIKVYDAGEASGLSYLVLELVEGPSLRERLERVQGPLDPRLAVRIGVGILGGLECAHRAGVVHRDLKPANVLLAPGDAVKLVDFGIARVLDDTARTQTREFLGTPRYASPEQARGELVEAGADQYAAGLIVYEMLAGRLPFESSTALGWLSQHMNSRPVPLGELCPALPPQLSAAVMKALAKAPAQRHVNAEAFLRAIAPFGRSRPAGRPG